MGVVYGDLKFVNLMFDKEENIKVMDFGLVCCYENIMWDD